MEFEQTKMSFAPRRVEDLQKATLSADRTPARDTSQETTDVSAKDSRPYRAIGEEIDRTTAPPGAYRSPIVVAPAEVNRRHLWREASARLTRIVIDPAVLDGVPTIRDTRISVAQLLDVLADVGTIESVVSEFADMLEAVDVQEALIFGARLAR